MKYELQCVNNSLLTQEEQTELNTKIDDIIARHKDNRYQINRLVFESTAALTAGTNLAREKASHGFFRRFWNNLTGKNDRLQADIDRNFARAQYASQVCLQRLAEQNLMSFELITAVNNKLNASMLAVDKEINNIYETMGNIYRYGINNDEFQFSENKQLALKYFEIAATMGYGRAQDYLGDMYWNGEGTVENKQLAIEWYKKAIYNGVAYDSTINTIARHFSNEGNGNNQEALRWWRIGEEHNCSMCMANLGWSYRYGKGVSVDYYKTVEYYKKAIKADSSNAYAERNLAEMYRDGYGVTTDRSIARSWYEKAAEHGDEMAKTWLQNNPN